MSREIDWAEIPTKRTKQSKQATLSGKWEQNFRRLSTLKQFADKFGLIPTLESDDEFTYYKGLWLSICLGIDSDRPFLEVQFKVEFSFDSRNNTIIIDDLSKLDSLEEFERHLAKRLDEAGAVFL